MRRVRNSLYPKLAWQNIRQNRRFFVPYLLALTGLAAAFYVMAALCFDPGVSTMRGFDYVQVMMGLGMFVAGILSAVLVLYINSFLMKQRKKELGLYNILGMGKGNIALLQCWESVYAALIGGVGGLVGGFILHFAACAGLTKLLKFAIPFTAGISLPAVILSAVVFGALLVLALLLNLGRVGLSSPIELLRGGNTGEREPKTRWLLVVVGVAALGAGYFIAMTTSDPFSAIALYFLAVLLVIIGTYCLFVAVSVAILKTLRKNKRFYYQTGHFIGVSGMLYRMKRNAVGLANICILSTMVMVMISGTLSLYLGTGEIIEAQFPADFQVQARYSGEVPEGDIPFDPQAMAKLVERFAGEQNVPVKDVRLTEYVRFEMSRQEDGWLLATSSDRSRNRMAYFLTPEGYAAVTGEQAPALTSGQAAVCDPEWGTGTMKLQTLHGDEMSLEVTETLPAIPYFSITNDAFTPVCFVVPDDGELDAVYRFEQPVCDRDYRCTVFLDLEGNVKNAEKLENAWWDAVSDTSYFAPAGYYNSLSVNTRASMAVDGYAMAGGFLFLGVLLGIIFLMATVLIIYYKQVSEGYEDQGRFEIMRKVGLGEREVKHSVKSQVLMVFFLPIAVAAVHILFDFNLVVQLLSLFAVRNITVTALCTAGTLLVFCLVYGCVYLLTARTYYKIVK